MRGQRHTMGKAVQILGMEYGDALDLEKLIERYGIQRILKTSADLYRSWATDPEVDTTSQEVYKAYASRLALYADAVTAGIED